jgi:hypothetical protein
MTWNKYVSKYLLVWCSVLVWNVFMKFHTHFRPEGNTTWRYAFLFASSRITGETVQKGKFMEGLIL